MTGLSGSLDWASTETVWPVGMLPWKFWEEDVCWPVHPRGTTEQNNSMFLIQIEIRLYMLFHINRTFLISILSNCLDFYLVKISVV